MLYSRFSTTFLVLINLTPHVAAIGRPAPIIPIEPGRWNYTRDIPQMGNSTFQQFIDHNNPNLGTFSQFYYYSDAYYGGPGSPVVLMTPGEAAVNGYQGYLTNRTLTGLFAQAIGAAVIVIEHRYYGWSSPFTNLTTDNMQYLTLNQSIADLTNFARTANLPFDPYHTSAAPSAPWLLSGGSYSGALTAWTAATAPGTFYAYTATSAVVETLADFWTYFEPVKQGMPQNCSTDVELVINYVDNVLKTGTPQAQTALKSMFGLGALQHNDDFGAAIENGPWTWHTFFLLLIKKTLRRACNFILLAASTRSVIVLRVLTPIAL